MKKTILLFLAFFSISQMAISQRYAVIDTKYILERLPDYVAAQKKLDELSVQWQNEIDAAQLKLDKMYRAYDAEQVLLTDELRKKRENELIEAQQAQNKLQKDKFGVDGEFFRKRQELVKPIQDRVYNAVQKMAMEKQYDFVLDKSEGITIIFADPKLDKSADILRALGVK